MPSPVRQVVSLPEFGMFWRGLKRLWDACIEAGKRSRPGSGLGPCVAQEVVAELEDLVACGKKSRQTRVAAASAGSARPKASITNQPS